MLALDAKLGPLLWQLPPTLGFDPARLAAYFELLPRTTPAAAELASRHDERVAGRAWTAIDADRPLRHADDYRRFSGRLVKLVVPAGVVGPTHFEGRRAGVEDESVILQVGRRKERRIPLVAISRARLEVEF